MEKQLRVDNDGCSLTTSFVTMGVGNHSFIMIHHYHPQRFHTCASRAGMISATSTTPLWSRRPQRRGGGGGDHATLANCPDTYFSCLVQSPPMHDLTLASVRISVVFLALSNLPRLKAAGIASMGVLWTHFAPGLGRDHENAVERPRPTCLSSRYVLEVNEYQP